MSSKRQLWEDVVEVYRQMRSSSLEEINGHVGTTKIVFEGANGGFGMATETRRVKTS
jgi:hypothetical protein